MKLKSKQFVDFWGRKVLVKVKRESYVGRLLREDIDFLFLEDVNIVEAKTKSPKLAISKKAIIELRELPEEGAN